MTFGTSTHSITARFLAVAATVTVALALTGCTPASEASGSAETPSASSSAAPSVPPTPAEEVATEPTALVISTTQIQLLREDGTVADEFDLVDPVDRVVATLTELFGAKPEVTTYEGTVAADYDWVGFQIGTDGPTDTPQWPETYVTATAAEINGITIASIEGHRVGDGLQALEAANPDSSHRWQSQTGEELVVEVQPVPYEPGEAGNAFHTELVANPSDGPITRISAPRKNFE